MERTETLLAGVGDPHRHFNSLLIGGTNGKGSVAALCDGALRARQGGRIGLYTSPHLISFAERIRIDGRPVDGEVLARAAETLRPAIEAGGASFFEATTAIAFLVFAEASVETAVVEVGLGGRLDATNVLQPSVAVVTNVALDHAEYLGDEIAGIAREKAGIFKRGIPALAGDASPEVERVLRQEAETAGAEFFALEELAAAEGIGTSASGTRFTLKSNRWGIRSVRIPLSGAHQARNAALAAEALGVLPARLAPDWEHLAHGFAGVRWPGRLQIEVVGGTTFLLDVAHNPAGALSLAEALDQLELPEPHVLVVGILKDKAWRGMIRPLTEQGRSLILTTPASAPPERRWDPEAVAAWVEADLGAAALVVSELGAALDRAREIAGDGSVIVTGSVHTVGDAMLHLGLPVEFGA
ncbi:MAG: Mur ligase family protein [Gemmatimonadota bacterium]